MITIIEIEYNTDFLNSGYEAYDRLSPTYAKFCEGLTAVHSGEYFSEVSISLSSYTHKSNATLQYARAVGLPILTPRGSPDNVGTDLKAVQWVQYYLDSRETR
jgi:hypothetical protein